MNKNEIIEYISIEDREISVYNEETGEARKIPFTIEYVGVDEYSPGSSCYDVDIKGYSYYSDIELYNKVYAEIEKHIENVRYEKEISDIDF